MAIDKEQQNKIKKPNLANFFEHEVYIDINEEQYTLKLEYKDVEDIKGFLQEYAQNGYKVVLHAMNEIKFGYYNLNNSGEFTFADNHDFDEKYMLQLRIFNQKEEFLVQEDEVQGKYKIQRIVDNVDEKEFENEGHLVKATFLDDESPLFGECIKTDNIDENFKFLQEKGRKISLIIPCKEKAKHYALVTRSYINFDEKTGQAGIGYYRYLDIKPQEKK